MSLSVAQIARADSVPGSVKTVISCGQQGNTNSFDEGQTVRGEGKNFTDNKDYRWTVKKVDQPAQGTEVSNGTFHLNNNVEDFCIIIYDPALSIAGDDHSVFKWEVEKKEIDHQGHITWHKVDSDNFFVNAEEEPVDLCTNLEGVQTEIPHGYEDPNQDKICTEIPPVDLCSNLEGNQATMPQGYEDPNQDGICTLIPPTDVCPNIEGNQSEVPEGYELKDGSCVPQEKDLCDNIGGVQTEVPEGYIRNSETNTCSLIITSSTPTPTPMGGGTIGKPKIKISPQVLGTTAPSAQPLPVTGADVNYSWIYYFLIIASLSFTYYMKAAGWKKFSR